MWWVCVYCYDHCFRLSTNYQQKSNSDNRFHQMFEHSDQHSRRLSSLRMELRSRSMQCQHSRQPSLWDRAEDTNDVNNTVDYVCHFKTNNKITHETNERFAQK